ncbi:MAG: hypothetical protein RR049_03135, partial [Angelakisella sp.]
MSRTINVSVQGEFARKDGKNAGVQGEANVTTLHITMSADWEAFSKRIIWRDAMGEKPVSILLYSTVQQLVSGKNPLMFDTAIPAEPLAHPGWCSFTIEGFRDSDPTAVAITVSSSLLVKGNDAHYAPAEPSPTQAQQLQVQMDGVVPQVSDIVAGAVAALHAAEEAVKIWEVWNPQARYLPLQKVSRHGSSYICTAANVGVDPALDVANIAQGNCWLLIAEKGQQGRQGTTGAQGITGIQGESGERGLQGGIGPQGNQGQRGMQGPYGNTGPAGQTGPAGSQGT